jgi:hypothetical protein
VWSILVGVAYPLTGNWSCIETGLLPLSFEASTAVLSCEGLLDRNITRAGVHLSWADTTAAGHLCVASCKPLY